jgi:hypothetical protein
MKKLLAALIVLVAIASGAEATLIDLHNGLVLDTFNGIYWTQNANMRGPDTWPNQLAWAADLNFAGLSDFHLPSLAALRNLYNELIAEGLCKPNAFSTGVSDCTGSIDLSRRSKLSTGQERRFRLRFLPFLSSSRLPTDNRLLNFQHFPFGLGRFTL